jgi:hypothetical protein
VTPTAPRSLGDARARLVEAWERRERLGESDCEEIRPGLVAQPANAASSLAYVAAGCWVAAGGIRSRRPAAVAFGALLGAVGVGSVLYHGPCPPGAQQAHDTSLAAALGVMVLHNAAAVTGRAGLVRGSAQLAAAAAAAVPVLPSARLTNPVVGMLGATALATEVATLRGGRPREPAAVVAGCMALGGLVHGLSRTGGPLCRPRSLLQGHAVWHGLSAVALAAWARGALLPPG